MIQDKDQTITELLQSEWELLTAAVSTLDLSIRKCQLIEIRDLRNQIAHEYLPEAIRDLVPEVIELASQLFKNIEVCHNFIVTREWIKTRQYD